MSEDISDAMITLTKAIKDDPEYAWSWHCNLACAAQDSGMDHAESQIMARRFMGWAFQCADYSDGGEVECAAQDTKENI